MGHFNSYWIFTFQPTPSAMKNQPMHTIQLKIFHTSKTFILTAPIMWSKHWLIDTPLPPLLVCMVTGTTFPRTDKWLCQKRARLDEVPEQMLVVGPLGTTKSKGVPGSLRFEEKDKNTLWLRKQSFSKWNLHIMNMQCYSLMLKDIFSTNVLKMIFI